MGTGRPWKTSCEIPRGSLETCCGIYSSSSRVFGCLRKMSVSLRVLDPPSCSPSMHLEQVVLVEEVECRLLAYYES